MAMGAAHGELPRLEDRAHMECADRVLEAKGHSSPPQTCGCCRCLPCRIEVVSLQPRAYVLHGFLSDAGRCWGVCWWQGSEGWGSTFQAMCLADHLAGCLDVLFF